MKKILFIISVFMLSSCEGKYHNKILYDKKGNAYLLKSYMNHYDITELDSSEIHKH